MAGSAKLTVQDNFATVVMDRPPVTEHPGEYCHFDCLAREGFNAIDERAKPIIAAVRLDMSGLQ